jgi:oligoribonuclease NrnB/cAMP/cGMP phosphodiesterase (DHH superfamily)
MKPIVIYHANCWDGFCAAWLFHLAYPEAEFYPAHYGTEPPDVANDKDRRLFLVDFCYPRDVIFRLAALRHEDMVILDHHKTARDVLRDIEIELVSNNCGDALTVRFDMEKSGGRLAWEYLYENRLLPDTILTTNHSGYSLGVAPWLVDYTEDRDLWRHALPLSQEVNASLRSYALDFGRWDVLATRNPITLATEGEAILRYQRTVVADHTRNAREIELDGHKILAVNATTMFSEIAGELAEGRPFGAAWFVRSDGKRQWSLRSRADGLDVSEIARVHGGGGHVNAAGFEEDTSLPR